MGPGVSWAGAFGYLRRFESCPLRDGEHKGPLVLVVLRRCCQCSLGGFVG
jgi:hypothetical protein